MSPPLRRLKDRKPTAGEITQWKLIEAGLDLFGRYAFDEVSTRVLADRANVNLASIQYYFGSKEGLYHAVVRHIVEEVARNLHPVFAEIDRLLGKDEDPSEEICYTLFCQLLDILIAQALGSPESRKWVEIVMREQLAQTRAFEILYEGLMKPIHRCLCRLVAGIVGSRPDDQHTQLRVYALLGQVLIFHVSRAEVGRSLDWGEDYGPEEIVAIRNVIQGHVMSILGVP